MFVLWNLVSLSCGLIHSQVLLMFKNRSKKKDILFFGAQNLYYSGTSTRAHRHSYSVLFKLLLKFYLLGHSERNV